MRPVERREDTGEKERERRREEGGASGETTVGDDEAHAGGDIDKVGACEATCVNVEELEEKQPKQLKQVERLCLPETRLSCSDSVCRHGFVLFLF